MLVIFVQSLRVLDTDLQSTNCPEFFIPQPLICYIIEYDNRDIAFLFHNYYMKRVIFNIVTQCIYGPYLLFSEVILNLVTIHIYCPETPLLDYRISIDAIIFNIHQSLNVIETIIQHNSLTLSVNIFGGSKN